MGYSRFTKRANLNKKKSKKCRLCLKQKALIKKSHIIPEFMYQELFDEDHKLRSFSIKGLKKVKPIVNKPSSGEYEGGLLCADCDNVVIGQYEDYVSKVLYSGDKLPVGMAWNTRFFRRYNSVEVFSMISNIDYDKLKLFVLSILWRASITTRDFFSAVNLGKHEEIIRKMIIDGQPGTDEDYPMMFSSWRKEKTTPNDIILPPIKSKKDGNFRYILPINGLLIDIYFSFDAMPEKYKGLRLKTDGSMTLCELPPDIIIGLFFKSSHSN